MQEKCPAELQWHNVEITEVVFRSVQTLIANASSAPRSKDWDSRITFVVRIIGLISQHWQVIDAEVSQLEIKRLIDGTMHNGHLWMFFFPA